MQTHTSLLSAVTLSAAMFFGVAAMAAEMPKSGTDTVMSIFVILSPNSVQFGDRSFTTYEEAGVFHDDIGSSMLNNSSIHCFGSRETVGKDNIDNGSCIIIDKDGDQILLTYDGKGKGDRGGLKLVGGKGKFDGITGTGEWSTIAFLTNSDDKRLRGVVSNKITWKLP